jgi:HSP20 family molecular chaperone IbpA
MNPAKAVATPPVISRLTEDDPILARMHDLHLSIVRRAYELFKESGFNSREDLAEWQEAVSNLLEQLPLTVAETDDEFRMSAEVPGYSEEDLEIKVDTNRVLIAGSLELPTECESEKDEAICAARSSKEFVREYVLPAAIDPENVAAELKDGVLEIHLAKCAGSVKKPAESAQLLAVSTAA